jgi:hypothetical protein
MKYALIGDSHTQIVFPKLQQMIKASGDSVIISKPKAGWGVQSHLNDGLESLLKSYSPETVVYSLGGNNQDLDKNSYKAKIDRAIKAAYDSGAKRIIWVGPTTSLRQDVEDRHLWTHTFLKHYLPIRGVKYINVRSLTKDGHRDDLVHYPNEKYQEWAEYVFKMLPKFTLVQGQARNYVFRIPLWAYPTAVFIYYVYKNK